jgi:hypothetical protein
MKNAKIDAALKRIPHLPDSAVVPVAVAAEHDSVSIWTVRRTYPLVRLSPARFGVLVGYLRRRNQQQQPSAA